jgi:predicted acetyltransferase
MTKLQNEITGLIQFRPILNEYLNIFGGHIGYSIKPSKRKLGYASIAMMKMLNYIKSHSDLKEIIMTTSQNNLASRKIIITNGGQLIGKQFDLKQGKIVYRYKISLNE